MDIVLNNFFLAHRSTISPTPYSFTQHFHNYYELHFFIGGDVDYTVADTIYTLSPYDLLIIPPTVFHYANLKTAKNYERYILYFSEADVPVEVHSVLKSGIGYYNVADTRIIKNLLQHLFTFRDKSNEEDSLFAFQQILNIILIHLKYEEKKNHSTKIIHPTLSKILQYIDNHPHEQIDVNMLSKRFYVSVSWIFHIFKDNFGMSVTQYINNKKMLYAQQLLREGIPATKTSLLCGFEDYSTFYRQYKKYFKISPSKET